MLINLIPDQSVLGAPAGFAPAVQTAAHIIESAFTDNITINLRYGWGTLNGQSDPELTAHPTFALGLPLAGTSVDYSTLKDWLSSDQQSPNDVTALASLPVLSTGFPNSNNIFSYPAHNKKLSGSFPAARVSPSMVRQGLEPEYPKAFG